MIGFSPRGVIDLVFVFPLMTIWAVILDLLNILLSVTIIGGIILALAGAGTVGTWIVVRSGGKRSGEKENKAKQKGGAGEASAAREGEEAAISGGAKTAGREGTQVAAREGTEVVAREGAQTAAKTGAKVAAKTAGRSLAGVFARIGAATLLKAIPVVGMISSIVFGWTVMVLWEAFTDLRDFSMEAGD